MPSGAGGVPHAITVPGFSSRSQTSVFQQFPQRDEAAVMHDDERLHKAGFSNSEPVEDAPQDNHPDIDPPEELEPGFSNAKAVKSDEAPAQSTDSAAAADNDLDSMTVAELKDLASDRDVDLAGATKKADIIAAMKKG